MPVDRQTLESEVRFLIGGRDDFDSQLPTIINRAYRALTTRVEFPASKADPVSFNTVVGITAYNLPADYFAMRAVKNLTSGAKLVQESTAKFQARDLTTVGTATHYLLLNSSLRIYRTPNAIEEIQLWYRRKLPLLSQATSTHLLDDAWETPIIQEAAGYIFAALGEVERSKAMKYEVAHFIRYNPTTIVEELLDRNEAIEVIGLS